LSPAGTKRFLAMAGCDDDRLKSCIITASASVWSVPEMHPAQLDAVYRLLHPVRPNHLAVIQQTGAGKTHILRMLGVIERGIILFLSHCLHVPQMSCLNLRAPINNLAPSPYSILTSYLMQTNKSTTTFWSNVTAFIGPPRQLYSSSCRHSSL